MYVCMYVCMYMNIIDNSTINRYIKWNIIIDIISAKKYSAPCIIIAGKAVDGTVITYTSMAVNM